MEFLHEGIALGIDCIILGLCVREYCIYKRWMKCLKSAPELPLDGTLMKYVAKQENKRIPYAVIRGAVSPISGAPLRSAISPSVDSVIQVIKVSEHGIARTHAGFWTDHTKDIRVSSNHIPFKLRIGNTAVEVVGAVSAAVLDLDVVYNNYEAVSLSFFGEIFDFFAGVRRKGLQTTVEVLRCGSLITAVGEIELDGNVLRIQPSPVGPLLLTSSTTSSLIQRVEELKTSYLLKIACFSAIAAVFVGLIARKVYRKRKQQRDERKIREQQELERQQRRERSRPVDVPPDPLCIVCVTNPKEIIIMPCGHVCLCRDCSEQITLNCPVCRGHIISRQSAFIV